MTGHNDPRYLINFSINDKIYSGVEVTGITGFHDDMLYNTPKVTELVPLELGYYTIKPKEIKERTKMTPDQFVYWLQGFFEISDATSLTEKQVTIIKDHLQLLFKKETPIRTIPSTIESTDYWKGAANITC